MCKSVESAARNYLACKYALMRAMSAEKVKTLTIDYNGEPVKLTLNANANGYTAYMPGADTDPAVIAAKTAYNAANDAYKAARKPYAFKAYKKPSLSDSYSPFDTVKRGA